MSAFSIAAFAVARPWARDHRIRQRVAAPV
jgi:hypothetical protein